MGTEKYTTVRPDTRPHLDAEQLIGSIAQLEHRIAERFPDRGLANVCNRLLEISRHVQEQALNIARPIWWLRIVTILFAVLLAVLFTGLFQLLRPAEQRVNVFEFVQVLESAIQNLVFIGVAIYFLVRLEERFKRTRGLKAIHQLRMLAHVIDMHQLTKDPDRITGQHRATRSSPTSQMDAFQLRRYLSYCSEMLALLGKLAALYVQHLDDPVVLDSANQVESLTTGLSQKIWQKLMIVHNLPGAEVSPPTGTH